MLVNGDDDNDDCDCDDDDDDVGRRSDKHDQNISRLTCTTWIGFWCAQGNLLLVRML